MQALHNLVNGAVASVALYGDRIDYEAQQNLMELCMAFPKANDMAVKELRKAAVNRQLPDDLEKLLEKTTQTLEKAKSALFLGKGDKHDVYNTIRMLHILQRLIRSAELSEDKVTFFDYRASVSRKHLKFIEQ
ncbi:hypothetical protein VE04_03609 [Pseudogymnoascus sp. 24MN13]|nr:hypothetical protein VE04_03600 [Pseudogymnoascus sp. 24MN13]OBT55423.1 hypothetical protein VE04_03609 [Pseudogymnoascus sp. 24MN13]